MRGGGEEEETVVGDATMTTAGRWRWWSPWGTRRGRNDDGDCRNLEHGDPFLPILPMRGGTSPRRDRAVATSSSNWRC